MVAHFSFAEIGERLKLRSPLLMLDRAELDAESRTASGWKCVSINEQVFSGHFPVYPILPGVLQVGAMTQLSRLLFEALFPGEGVPALVSLRRVKFRAPVTPGSILNLACTAGEMAADGSCEFTLKNTLEDGSLASSAFLTLRRVAPDYFVQKAADGENPALAGIAPGDFKTGAALYSMLPHRFPFLLVDGVHSAEDGTLHGFRNVTAGDPLLQAVTPAVFAPYLQIESVAQAGCAILLSQPENADKLGVFMSIDAAQFFRPVFPGERMGILGKMEVRGMFGIATGDAYVGSSQVMHTEVKFALIPKEQH